MEQKSGTPGQTRQIVKEYDFNFLKRFGQNFLTDSGVLEKIVEAADVGKDDVVLEVGPGTGTLTKELAKRAGQVVTVEIDDRLIPILEDELGEYDNVALIHADVMKLDLEELMKPFCGGGSFQVVANLPYYLTTPLVMRLLETSLSVSSLTVMVQKEVAERMQAKPGTKEYGALSLAVAYYAKPRIVAEVPPSCFWPQPKVSSAVVHLQKLSEPPVSVKDPDLLFHLIRATFQKRRKTLVNSLSDTAEVSFTKSQVAQAAKACGLSPSVRGETLDLAQFAALSDALSEGGSSAGKDPQKGGGTHDSDNG